MTQRERWEMNNPGRVAILQPFGTASKAYCEWLESENDKLRGMIGARIMDVVNATHVDNLCKESRISVGVTDEMIEEAAEITEVAIIARKAFITGATYVRDRLTQPQSDAILKQLVEKQDELIRIYSDVIIPDGKLYKEIETLKAKL